MKFPYHSTSRCNDPSFYRVFPTTRQRNSDINFPNSTRFPFPPSTTSNNFPQIETCIQLNIHASVCESLNCPSSSSALSNHPLIAKMFLKSDIVFRTNAASSREATNYRGEGAGKASFPPRTCNIYGGLAGPAVLSARNSIFTLGKRGAFCV